MPKYKTKYRCVKCNGFNIVKTVEFIDNVICECETECTKCDHKDYWSYGHFKSEIKNDLDEKYFTEVC